MSGMPRRMSSLLKSGSVSSSMRNINEEPSDLKSFDRSSWLKTSENNSFENYDPDRAMLPKTPFNRAYLSLSSKSPSNGSRTDSCETSDGVEADMYSKKSLKSPVAQDSIRTNMTSRSSGFGTMSETSSNFSLNISLSSSTSGEVYKGEWIADKRNVYGISEYIDESRYTGAWKDNARHGYGMLTHIGDERSGKWCNDELTAPVKKGINLRSPRIKGKVRMAIDGAVEAAGIAMEKGQTALTRGVTARKISELAKVAADKAENHAAMARSRALEFDVKLSETGV